MPTLYRKDGKEATAQDLCHEVFRLTFRGEDELSYGEREALCNLARQLLDYAGGWQEVDIIHTAIFDDLIDEQQEWLAKELLPIVLKQELDK